MAVYFLIKISERLGLAGFAVGVLLLVFLEILRRKDILSRLKRSEKHNILVLIIKSVRIVAIFCIAAGAIGPILDKVEYKILKNYEDTPRTFKIIAFDDVELVKIIEGATELQYDLSNNATYNIRLTHTGGLRPAYQDGYYLFDGGVAVILVNDSKCCEIDSIRLTSWSDTPGNPKYLLERKIKEELKQKLKQNRHLVAECLIECLKNED